MPVADCALLVWNCVGTVGAEPPTDPGSRPGQLGPHFNIVQHRTVPQLNQPTLSLILDSHMARWGRKPGDHTSCTACQMRASCMPDPLAPLQQQCSLAASLECSRPAPERHGGSMLQSSRNKKTERGWAGNGVRRAHLHSRLSRLGHCCVVILLLHIAQLHRLLS